MREAIDEGYKAALKARDQRRTSTLRAINAAIKDRDIANRGEGKGPLTSEDILVLLQKMVKQREESFAIYANAGRNDLATVEKEEIDRPGVRRFIGRVLIGSYIKFVRATSRVVADPPDFWEAAQKDHWPAIAVSWHGQSNLAYVVMPDPSQVALLISMHPDGMMMGEMARSIGYQVVEGSGASERQQHGTGGLAAFRAMLKVLKSGTTLFATADIPPEPGRNVSLGMIALARKTGRPVYAIATATSRRKILERVWDKMQLNFPFSTIAFACEGPVYMTDPNVTDAAYAADLAERLDRVLAKAFDMADGKVSPTSSVPR